MTLVYGKSPNNKALDRMTRSAVRRMCQFDCHWRVKALQVVQKHPRRRRGFNRATGEKPFLQGSAVEWISRYLTTLCQTMLG